MPTFIKNKQYRKFCAYGFLKNLRFFDAFLILFFLDKGLSYTQIGMLYALREVTINVFEVPSGITADTLGRKRALIFALLAYIVSFIIFYAGNKFFIFLFAMLLYGIGDAFRSGTNKGMIMDYLSMNGWLDEKVNYYGHTRAWSQRGSAISSLIAGFLVHFSSDYAYIFLFALLPYCLNLINIWTYPDELNFSVNTKKRNQRKLTKTVKTFIHFIKQNHVRVVMNSAALHSSYLKSIKDYIQPLMLQLIIMLPFMLEQDITKKSGLIIGIIYFIIYILTSVVSKNAYKLTKLGWSSLSYKTLIIGLASGLLCGLFYAFERFDIALVFFIGIYIIENLRKPILTGELADTVNGDILTSVLSAQSFMQSIFTILISLSFGFLADQFSVATALVVVTIILISYTLILHLFNANSPSSKEDPI